MTRSDHPYLSLVVAARHDDHGGDFMRRMQAFITAFQLQCQRHRLPAEIVVVEWNPLADRCGLAQALEWPVETDWCQVRFIEVPPELHARFEHSPKIALYQMIAKNVGLRRVRGEFALATNIDILFNEELMSYFAERRLESGKMYRMDRYDADEGVPLWARVDEQLKYCETHVLRVNAREGTFRLNEAGHRTWSDIDIGGPDEGLALGEGWYAPEIFEGRAVRHLDDGAVVDLPALKEGGELALRMEPGPGADGPVTIGFELAGGRVVATQVLEAPSDVVVRLPAAARPCELRVRFEATRVPVAADPRGLMLRVWSIGLSTAAKANVVEMPVKESEHVPADLGLADRLAIWTRHSIPALHRAMAPAYRRATGRPDPEPVPSARVSTPQLVRRADRTVFHDKPADLAVHVNACGDFTLMHRDHWMDMRAYPEFDAYSMNIDAVFCWAAHYGGVREEILPEPMRIYHMEHAAGSGWTPEGHDLLYRRIKDSGLPWIEYGDVMEWVRSMRQLNCPFIFNRDDWGFRDDVFRETAPGLAPGDAALRWCRKDADSPSQTKARAEALCRVRPVELYPGWSFDADWYSDDAGVKQRRAVWERCAWLGWKLGVVSPWLEGTRVALDMRNEIGRQVFVGGCYDPNEFHWLSQVLKPGMVFVDVGANEGLYSVFAAARLGITGRVVALEPSAREFRALEANIALNEFQNVVARRLAVGDRAGRVSLRVAVAERSGLNSLGEFGLDDVGLERVEDVPLATLDQLMLELKPTHVDVVKLDIEGSETAVLRGAIATIERFRPWLLVELAERSLTQMGTSGAELCGLLRLLSYELLAIDAATGLPTPWNGEVPGGSINLICRSLGTRG